MDNRGVYKIKEEKFNSIFVMGDLHGDLDSFNKLLSKSKSDELVITLGDYTDRGSQGVELIESLKRKRREREWVSLKGNHESYTEDGKPKFSPSTFIEEVRKKKEDWENYFKSSYKPFLESLYIGAILEGKYLFVHGGITSEIERVEDLTKYEREVKWRDPLDTKDDSLSKCEKCVFECPFSKTGRPKFTIKDSRAVCDQLNVKKIIRSHQPKKASEGPVKNHEGKVITISSTSVYDGKPFALRVYTSSNKMKVIYSDGKEEKIETLTQD